MFHFTVPLTLYGEGEYNLNVVKEIRVTESYLGLDLNARECKVEDGKLNFSSSSLPLCSGLLVSSFLRAEGTKDSGWKSLTSTDISVYDNYMKVFKLPPGLKRE